MVTSVDSAQLFRFGTFEVDRRARELRKQGRRIRLQEQPFQVLLLLLEHAGEVVTREDLRERLWPSSVFVDFDHGLNNAIARLREALGDSAAAPHYIETLPRVGYRFIYPLDDAQRDSIGPANRVFRWRTPQRLMALTLMSALIAVLLIGLRQINQRGDIPEQLAAPSETPSIAVLPFVNMSERAENEYFADGLSEELANRLAGVGGLKVASQTSTFTFKGSREPAPAIARALNVNYLLEGSVRQSRDRVRISAQLIDAVSGYHLWSESFDRELTDVFRVQEDIAFAVAEALMIKLTQAEEQHLRTHGTGNAEAYRLYLIARAQISWVFGRPDWAAVKSSLEAAIALEPQFAAAHAFLAHYYFNHERDREASMQLGREHAERAVALDPELSEAWSARANFGIWQYFSHGDFSAYTSARADYRRALELDPSNDQASFHYARAVFWKEPELALSLFEKTLRLNPVWYSAEGLTAILLSRQGYHDEARRRAYALYDQNPDQRFHNAINIATLALYHGQLDEAAVFQREAMSRGAWWLPLRLWSVSMSLGDTVAASDALNMMRESGTAMALAEAARHCMNGRFDNAFAILESRRDDLTTGRILDVPAARLALIVSRFDHAAALLESRLPDLVTGAEPVNARNALPALDLVSGWANSGKPGQARELNDRVARFLDGPEAPQWPMFIFLRARSHALAGELQRARQALDRAYDAGHRVTWAVDIGPAAFMYIDPIHVDPAFEALRSDQSYQHWLERVEIDNARQLARLKARDVRVANQ